ncbi:hypothetical protein H9P43_008713 [Blastocladiella emersonii ATCC 22665]|nr:hypothetical protein H9P43_008713 [Blastocladiella emersonii ATCC 22665]
MNSLLLTRAALRVAATGLPHAAAVARPAAIALARTPIAVWAVPARGYAKKAPAAKGGKGGKKGGAAAPSESAGSGWEWDSSAMEKTMEAQVAHLRAECDKLSVGKASPTLLDRVHVKLHKAAVPLAQVAQVTVKDPHTLLVVVPEEEAAKHVEAAIRGAGLGLNPVVETKNTLKVPVPKPSADLRAAMAKQLHKAGEDAKAKVRAARQTELAKIKGKKGGSGLASLSEDDQRALQNDVQKIADKYCADVDAVVKAKTKQLTGA